jgi:hypothetical protein
LEGWPDIFV